MRSAPSSAVHIAAIHQRPAFLDWPDNDALTASLVGNAVVRGLGFKDDDPRSWVTWHQSPTAPPNAISAAAPTTSSMKLLQFWYLGVHGLATSE